MIDTLGRYGGPMVLAIFVHLLALAGVVYQWSEDDRASRELADQPMIVAKLVSMRPSSPHRKPAKPPPSAPDKPLQKIDIPDIPKPQAVDKVLAPLPPLPKPKDAKSAASELRQREQRALDDALRAEAASLAADSSAEAVQSYSERIAQLVGQAWSRPPSARNGMQTVLQIELVPTGEVVRVLVKRSSGDEAFDRAAVDAVRQVGRFDVPTEPDVFDKHFRRFLFRFNPEDLLR